MKHAVFSTLLGLAISGQAASDEVCWVSYDDFERMVPHTDLLTCPKEDIASQDGFCRLNIVGDTVTIYQFEAGPDDEFCLMRGRGYQLESFLKRYGSHYTVPD